MDERLKTQIRDEIPDLMDSFSHTDALDRDIQCCEFCGRTRFAGNAPIEHRLNCLGISLMKEAEGGI